MAKHTCIFQILSQASSDLILIFSELNKIPAVTAKRIHYKHR